MYLWRYEKVDVRDDVKLALPKEASMEVYKITSGNSGKTYYVQVLTIWHHNKAVMKEPQTIYLCNCPEGFFRAPLSVLGIESPCKHAQNLESFLKEKRSK